MADRKTIDRIIGNLHQRLQVARQDAVKGGDKFEEFDSERSWAEANIRKWVVNEEADLLRQGDQPLSDDETNHIVTAVADKSYGLGLLDQLLRDENVSDIHVMGSDYTMLRMRDGSWMQAPGIANSNDELMRIIQTAAARHGGNIERRFDNKNPELNMQLKDGSRLFACRDVTDSPQMVIRKHDHSLGSLQDLVNTGMIPPHAAHFLETVVKARLNMVIVGSTGSGKAHPLDEAIPTPNGWTTVGDIQPGDEVFASDGAPIKVLDLSEVRDEKVYTVTFEDGRTVRCSADHLWEVSSAYSRGQHTPHNTTKRARSQDAHQARIAELDALIRELPGDLYGTIKQIAEWASMSVTPLHRTTPKSLGVEREVEGSTKGPLPKEIDASAFWSHLETASPASVGGVAVTAELLAETRPAAGEWLTARQVAQRLAGDSWKAATTSVNRLIRHADVASRPGTRDTTVLTVYPVREVLHRYREDLASRNVGDVPLTTVLTTEQLAADVTAYGRTNWAVEKLPALDMPEADLPIDPWLLGAWLGDGSTDAGIIHVGNNELAEMLSLIQQVWPSAHAAQEQLPDSTCWAVRLPRPRPDVCVRDHDGAETRIYGTSASSTCMDCERGRHRGTRGPRTNVGLQWLLRDLGALGAKHIPVEYLRASREQRLALLQGLMDTDGTIDVNGNCELGLSDERLADDALTLIRSLGIIASKKVRPAGYHDDAGTWVECKDVHRIHFTTDQPVFRLARKAERLPDGLRRPERIGITSIDVSDETVPMRCLYVDAPDHLYLAGDYVPTHNTTLLRALCACMPAHEHKITIEEAKEIGLGRDTKRHPLVREMEVRPPDMMGVGGVDAQQLVRMSLRMDPDRIILGEVRGGEALQMLTAMTQGQAGSICTMHGDSAAAAYPRLQLYVKFGGLDVPDEDVAKLITDAIHFVVFAAKVPVGNGRYQRVISEIIETRGRQGSQVSWNAIANRDNPEGELRPVVKPSERTMERLLAAGFNYDFWMGGSGQSAA